MTQHDNLPPLPSGWSEVDGAVAFHLIDLHAENWQKTGQMMEAWADARSPWRTIESAPKNSDLLFAGANAWPPVVGVRYGELLIEDVYGNAISATHWMPIPPLPEVKP